MTIHRVEAGHIVIVWTGALTDDVIERLRRIHWDNKVTIVHGKVVR